MRDPIPPPRHTPEATRIIRAMRDARDAARKFLDVFATYRTSYTVEPDEIETARKLANWEIPEL